MLYIKILRDSTVIGAEEHENPVYINHPYYSSIPLRCTEEAAQGILSADNKEIYHLKGRADLPDGYLEAEEISKAEYDYLVEELDIDDDTEPEPSPDDEDSGSDVMTPQQMRERIIALEADRAELREELSEKDTRIGYLEDAMLEVGGILYGDDDI